MRVERTTSQSIAALTASLMRVSFFKVSEKFHNQPVKGSASEARGDIFTPDEQEARQTVSHPFTAHHYWLVFHRSL